MRTGGGHKKRFQFCIDYPRSQILYLRANQGHSGEKFCGSGFTGQCVDPNDIFEYIYHVGSCFNLHSIIKTGLIAGQRTHGRDRQTVFFTAVDPMDKNWVGQEEYDLTQPRLVAYKKIWKIIQDAVYWVNIGRAQHMWLKFFHTKSNTIFLPDTLPPSCMEKVMSMKSKEILYTKTESPRPAPTVMLKSAKTWTQKLLKEKEQPVILRSFASRSEQQSQ